MIIDSAGVILLPGNGGRDCPGNGLHTDEKGEQIECCCDECNYALCCYEPSLLPQPCSEYDETICPRSPYNTDEC